ncbi:hypothetical protein CON07_19400 [Bacillus sp. AFS094611]|nr:hypothetical protein BK725_05960 [Bacillus thuringiensis serovar guiyangiensis]PDZ49644.1 hypothetical protein CON07_19400 [Bacillus sp. AFS094611]
MDVRYICKINKVYPNYRELKKLRDISLQKAKLNKKDTCIKNKCLFYNVLYAEGKDWIMIEKYNVTSKK